MADITVAHSDGVPLVGYLPPLIGASGASARAPICLPEKASLSNARLAGLENS